MTDTIKSQARLGQQGWPSIPKHPCPYFQIPTEGENH